MILALVVALGGGGAGWWFAFGPGSVTAGAAVAGLSVDSATSALTTAGFVVIDPPFEEYHPDVPEGMVVTTSPEISAGMPKGSEVHLVISLGPEPIALPNFEGITTVDYSAQLAKLGIAVVDTSQEFNKSVPAGEVIKLSTADGVELAPGDTVYSGDAVLLTESVGKVPNVKGMTVAEATETLESVDLTVNGKMTEEFSTTVDAGLVISVTAAGGAIHPGGSVTLVVSKGPELVTIPGVSGMTIDAAIQLLESVGFDVSVVTDIPKKHWAQEWAEAGSTEPGEGTSAPKGSTVTLFGKI
jgi:serine/threonine-protein kinase